MTIKTKKIASQEKYVRKYAFIDVYEYIIKQIEKHPIPKFTNDEHERRVIFSVDIFVIV